MNNFEVDKDYRLLLRGSGDANRAPGTEWIQRLAVKFCSGTGIDVGSAGFIDSITCGLPGAIPVDLSIPNSGSAEHLVQASGSLDYYFSSHCWEHLHNPELASSEAYRVLKPCGIIFLYLPYPDNTSWDPKLNDVVRPLHLWQPTPSTISRLLLMTGFSIEYCEQQMDQHWSFVVVAKKPIG